MEKFILGIDEVGLGPWAGPLVMGGVILPAHGQCSSGQYDLADPTQPPSENDLSWISELKDSKKLSAKKRERLHDEIERGALAYATGWVTADELNKIGISAGLQLAARRVVENIQKQNVSFHQIIIDGNKNYLAGTALEPFTTTLINGDEFVKEISAASIYAKVERDRYMINLADEYPGYDFEHNVGYGTPKHIDGIDIYGITPEHRIFIKAIARKFGFQIPDYKHCLKQNTTTTGRTAEAAVADFLKNLGHKIVERNYRTKTCEIDIISEESGIYYFTEVKYRKTDAYGSGFESITKAKQKQMRFAAEVYLKNHYLDCPCYLAAAQVSGNYEVDDWFTLD